MSTEIRSSIAARLREERHRLQLSQQQLADVGGVKLRTLQDWERSLSPVQTEFLAATRPHGMDVLYVVTGERTTAVITPDALGPDEVAHLKAYNALPEKAKATIKDLVALLAGGVNG